MSELEPTDKPPGLVCTFYSYKGGVGRSMALANVGVLMATEGHRVLLVDWDLEAPGLEQYFQNAARLVGTPSETPGVVDLLHAHAESSPLPWRKCLLKAEFFGHSLDILSSGRRNDDYRRRVQALDWKTLFQEEHRIGNYINSLREDWRTAYDFVLVDSRTGITDIGDICTVILPDILVFLFVTNHQSVEGTKDVMARAINARSKMPVNRSKLLGVPVPARDERDREYDKSIEWQRIFATEFGDLYREWLPKEVTPSDALNHLFIPYVASWSFGEHVPVIESERERADPTSLGAAYARLSTLLSHRLDWSAIAASASAADVVGARVELSKVREEAREAEIRRAEEEKRRQEELVVADAKRLEVEKLLAEAHARRRKLRNALLALIVLLILVIFAAFLWLSYQARRAAEEARHAAEVERLASQKQAEMAEMAKKSELSARRAQMDAEIAMEERHRAASEIEAVTSLTDAGFRWNRKEKHLEAVTGDAKDITTLEPFAEYLRDLSPRSLKLSGCRALKNVQGVTDLYSLESLDLSSCSALQDVDALMSKGERDRLTSLKTLNLSSCSALQSVAGLAGLAALQNLDLSDCIALRNIDALTGLTTLQQLNLSGCTSLQSDALKKLSSALPKTEITLPDGKKSKP